MMGWRRVPSNDSKLCFQRKSKNIYFIVRQAHKVEKLLREVSFALRIAADECFCQPLANLVPISPHFNTCHGYPP